MKFMTGSGIAALVIAAISAPSIAQSTVQELRSANTVSLSGEVVRVIGDDFVLNDGTGQILVEAETYAIRDAAISAGSEVIVTGTYDEDEFNAVTITPANGETIYVFDD